jgi:LysR family hca operon transcriptional activator
MSALSLRQAIRSTTDFATSFVRRATTHDTGPRLRSAASTSSLFAVELRHLRYFVAVAEELNFTRAASRLRTSQPSLSQQIRQLEAEVDVPLLDRSRHHVLLTDAGRIFLREVKDILGRIEHARRLAQQAADGRAGELAVGTFPAADARIVPSLRPLIAARLPHVHLVLHSKYAVDPANGLHSGALDVAFMRGPLTDERLEVVELLREPIVAVMPAHHALARRKQIPVSLLDDLPCITMDRTLAPALHDAIALVYRQAQIRMHAVSRADNVLGHLQLVQEGLGFALLPESVGALLPPGVVLKPLATNPPPMVSIVVAWKRGNASPLVRAFVDLVRESLGARGSTAQPQKHKRARR